VLDVLVKNFNIMPIGTPDEDLKASESNYFINWLAAGKPAAIYSLNHNSQQPNDK
jgi:hypothetical protein